MPTNFLQTYYTERSDVLMLFTNNIPHLTVYRQKTYLPVESKTQGLYSLAFINNNSAEATANIMKHPLANSNRKYLCYYMESYYREKIGSVTINKNFKPQRDQYYKEIDELVPNFHMYNTYAQYGNKNMYYDLRMFNDIFFKNIKVTIMKNKIEMYMKYLHKTINNPNLNNYKNKIMLIDVEAWEKSDDKINNPVFYIFLAFKKYFEIFQLLGDIDIIFITDSMMMRVNPSQCTKEDFQKFKINYARVCKTIDFSDETVEKALGDDVVKTMVVNNLGRRYGFTGNVNNLDKLISDVAEDEEIDPDDEALEDDLDTEIADTEDPDRIATNLTVTDKRHKLDTKIDERILADEELAKTVSSEVKAKATGKSTLSLQRDEELRKKQRDLVVKGKTLSEITETALKVPEIREIDVSSKIQSTNPHIGKIKFANFEAAYNEGLMQRDTMNVFTNLNNMPIPVYIKNIEIEDSSNELNYKDTYRIKLEDENRVQHSITVDIPKFVDDKFLYLNGNKKIIIKQEYLKPIVKTGPDKAQVCTAYNKIFINRVGTKMSPKIEKVKRAVVNPASAVYVVNGDCTALNNTYKTTIEYDELAKSYVSIKSGNIEIMFSQADVKEKLAGKKVPDGHMCIGFNNGKPILLNYETEMIGNVDIVDYMVTNFGDKFTKVYNETTAGSKRFMYTTTTLMRKAVPMILLLGYCEGITTVLRKANIEHYFTDKKPKLDSNEAAIQFEDGYLVYKAYPLENSLLLNGLQTIPTRSYPYEAFDEKDVYMELFESLYGARKLANAFDNFYMFMIDPISKEILELLDYPTDFVSVVLFANAMLADNSYILENNMNLYRIRSNEIINAILHKEIATAYSRYYSTANRKNPVKISVPKDAVINKLLEVNTLEEYSTLNPIYELEKTHAVTPKGVNGLNEESAYTQDKRSYDKSMLGVIGMSTSNDGSCGIVRKLSLEPNIINARGFMNLTDNLDELNGVNLFTPSESLTPLAVLHDDAIRTAINYAVAL